MAQQSGAQERSVGLFQANSNNDGAVTRSEYDASRVARFNALDANNDGQLTREEMRAGHERGERCPHTARSGPDEWGRSVGKRMGFVDVVSRTNRHMSERLSVERGHGWRRRDETVSFLAE